MLAKFDLFEVFGRTVPVRALSWHPVPDNWVPKSVPPLERIPEELPQAAQPERGAHQNREASRKTFLLGRQELISLKVSNLDQTATSKERRFVRVRPDRAAPPSPPTPQPPG